MKYYHTHTFAGAMIGACMAFVGCSDSAVDQPDIPQADAAEDFSGGDTTHFIFTQLAFDKKAPNLTHEQGIDFEVGDSFFNSNWVAAPASTTALDGLGPLFNAQACNSCHQADGRGRPPIEGENDFLGLLFRLSVRAPTVAPDAVAFGMEAHTVGMWPMLQVRRLTSVGNQVFATLPDAVYGGQFNRAGISGVPAEGKVEITYEEIPGTYADGEAYSLRKPTYTFVDLGYGPMATDILVSPRTAPHMIGMGLLEAIPEQRLRALADPDDANDDGISGKINMVPDPSGGPDLIGRFGWKANKAYVRHQVAGAFNGDIGITSAPFPEDQSTTAQTAAQAAPNGGEPELQNRILDRVTFYSQTVGVPGRRDSQTDLVLKGRQLFREMNCSACHVPEHTTGEHEVEALSNQRIFPYTDLLVHDMGDGLADGRPDHQAGTHEWRTPPLWGVGLFEKVNDHNFLLHDGRARGFAEAILWHGGEAEASKEAFRQLSAPDRAAVVAFLESL